MCESFMRYMCGLIANGVCICMSFKGPNHDKPIRTQHRQQSETYRPLNITTLEPFDTALVIENRRGVDLVLHKVFEPMKLCCVNAIVNFAAQKKKISVDFDSVSVVSWIKSKIMACAVCIV